MNYLLGYLLLYSSNAPVLYFWQGPGVKMNDPLEGEPMLWHGSPAYQLTGWVLVLGLLGSFGLGILVNFLWRKFRGRDEKQNPLVSSPPASGEDPVRMIWNSMEEGLLLSSEKGEIIAINPFLQQMASGTAGQVPQRKTGDLFKNDSFFDFYQSLVLPGIEESNGKGYVVELKMPFKAGTRNIELFVNKIYSNGKEKRIILSLFREISGRKLYSGTIGRNEDSIEAQKLKTSFFSHMSHEIRTPLNGILGSTANIILKNSHNPELVSQMEIIMQSGERLLDTINNFLDMSRIEAEELDVLPEEININDCFSKILMPLRSMAIEKGLLLTAKYETQPFMGRIDKRHFELIVNNIVGNAIKFAHCGLIEAKLIREKENLHMLVGVRGMGINKPYSEQLFSFFEQKNPGQERKFEGPWLELTVAKNLIDRLSGKIQITREKDQTTVVNIMLPLAEHH